MERRELLGFAGMAAIAGAFVPDATAQNSAPAQGQTHILRIYADAEGDSHVEELTVAPALNGKARSLNLPVGAALIRESGSNSAEAWHNTPSRQFAVAVAGELEVEVSGGIRRHVGTGQLVFLEDTKGKGHVTRFLGPVTNLFLRVPDSFDVVAWVRGDA
jgi:hypothetical protein